MLSDIPWFYLTENGPDALQHPSFIRSQDLQRAGIILGDPDGLTEAQEDTIAHYSLTEGEAGSKIDSISLGTIPLLASHCIVIFLFLLENRVLAKQTKG